jgi:hypothetical protein
MPLTNINLKSSIHHKTGLNHNHDNLSLEFYTSKQEKFAFSMEKL